MTAVPKRLAEMSVRISQAPASADRCRLTAIALQKQGRIDQAISLYLRGLAFNPSDASAYRCLGTAYKTRKQLDLAAACFRRAVELCPAFPEAWNNLGNTLAEQQDDAGAAACFERAFTVQPHFAGAHFNFANALGRLGRFDEAIAACRRATELSPRSAEFYNGLGMALYDARRIDEAVTAYDQAVRLRPDFAPARYNRSHAWLLLGDYARGWPEYEWRWKLPAVAVPSFPQPRWDGTNQPDAHNPARRGAGTGRHDSVHSLCSLGQGSGRNDRPSLPEAVGATAGGNAGNRPSHLAGRADRSVRRLVSALEPAPLFHLRRSRPFQTASPICAEDQAILRFWQERLERIDGLRIGINWQGNPAFPKDRFRSVPLRYFEPMARIAGVRLISLQKGVGREQLENRRATFPVLDLGLSMDEVHGPFVDTAAILRGLDLVITSDTSLAHLGGALGVETWLAVPSVPEWRWLLGREDSPWYPTLRLFRQNRPGQWADVFSRMAARLGQRVAARRTDTLNRPQSFPSPPR